jgi:hypothetical protein
LSLPFIPPGTLVSILVVAIHHRTIRANRPAI